MSFSGGKKAPYLFSVLSGGVVSSRRFIIFIIFIIIIVANYSLCFELNVDVLFCHSQKLSSFIFNSLFSVAD